MQRLTLCGWGGGTQSMTYALKSTKYSFLHEVKLGNIHCMFCLNENCWNFSWGKYNQNGMQKRDTYNDAKFYFFYLARILFQIQEWFWYTLTVVSIVGNWKQFWHFKFVIQELVILLSHLFGVVKFYSE